MFTISYEYCLLLAFRLLRDIYVGNKKLQITVQINYLETKLLTGICFVFCIFIYGTYIIVKFYIRIMGAVLVIYTSG